MSSTDDCCHRQKDLSSQKSERGTKRAKKETVQEALDLEYQSLLEHGTWKFTKLPIGYKALPCHWVLAVKYNDNGSIERFRVILVAQGNHQEFGVNCDEVYAPVARFGSLRLVLAIGTILDCHIHQMDVHMAFLNGSMDGEQKVYLYQPPGICGRPDDYVKGHETDQSTFDLLSRFTMKDVGDIHYILKMEVRRNREKRAMTISQHSYINDLL
ncbi:Integrase, catalytic core protein [Phytophthora megakarya]|uniref:Integrase, catalytic core protein n=1 Tax=Phytophthora megakarya TaxID=4795 RepID=A0A225WHJ0_9STRA|nr:Integrase, catalytic core protein [Phytophthora megakarya]